MASIINQMQITKILLIGLSTIVAASAEPSKGFSWVKTDAPVSILNNNQSTISESFTAKNTSNEELSLLHAYISCGCTKAEWDKTPVKPGEEITITLEYTAPLAGHGRTIRGNFLASDNTQLSITWEIKDAQSPSTNPITNQKVMEWKNSKDTEEKTIELTLPKNGRLVRIEPNDKVALSVLEINPGSGEFVIKGTRTFSAPFWEDIIIETDPPSTTTINIRALP